MSSTTTTATRYSVAALVRFHDEVTRYPLGAASSRRKARKLGYTLGATHYPLLSRIALFELEIVDTLTGALVRATGAETEAYHRARAIPTVGDILRGGGVVFI